MVCSRTFSATTGTAYARNRRPKADFDRVIEMHSEGMTKAAIARVVKVSPGTVARWIAKAAAHARALHDCRTRTDEASEVQLDELSCRGSGKAERAWVFSGIEVSSRLWLGLRVGTRTERNTRIHVREVSDRLTGLAHWTVFTTDGFKYYAKAMRHVFRDKPTIHVQVDNKYAGGRIVRSRWKQMNGSDVILSDMMRANEDSKRPNTAFIERLNLTKRMSCSLLRRRNPSPARNPQRIQEALELVRLLYNYVKPHSSLRGLRGKTTPAMAAGITNRPVRLRELMSWTVPPAEARRIERQRLFARASW